MDKKISLGKELIYAVVSIAVTLLASCIVYWLNVPNPVIVLVILMIVFTACFGNVSGAFSGICIIFYALFFFSERHTFVSFTAENGYKCLVIVCSLVMIYLFVAILKSHHDIAYIRLKELNRQLEEQNIALEDESDHDALSGIYNRRGGDRRVSAYLSADDGTLKAVLAAMDIDDFKNINDVYGHGAGDKAIQLLITQMKKDFPEKCILIRNGGDEFQAFLYGDDIPVLEQKIHDFSERTFHLNFRGQQIDFHISCGYAYYPEQARTMGDLYRKADTALYDAKINGKQKAFPYTWEADTKRPDRFPLTISSISNNLPVSFLIYRADESEEILIASATLLEMYGCRDFSELITLTGGSFSGFVYPDDVERVEKSIEDQIQVNERGLDIVDYRIRTKDGSIKRIRDLGRLIHDPELGDLFYVVLYDRDAMTAS